MNIFDNSQRKKVKMEQRILISVSEHRKLLLSSRIPNLKDHTTEIREPVQGNYCGTHGC